MRVAVVGCGMIAQEHLRSIKLCPQAQIVGIADPNPQVLQVTADKWGIAERFTDPATLIAQTKPDVVHIATPPDTHYALTRLALEAGCHVYVEKPVTLRSPEAPELVELAARKGKMLCIGYMHIFDRVMLEAQRLVREGAIGKLCGIESYYGFDLGTTPGGRYFTQAYTHWAYKLPGGLFQNGLDHPLSVVMPFMSNPTKIFAAAAEVGVLPKGVPGELRIMLAQDDLVATVTLSEAASPRWHYLTLLGTGGTLKVDLQNKRLICYAHKHGIPHFVTRAWMNINEGLRVLGGTVGTFVDVIRKKFTPYEGMQRLVAEFYKAIETNGANPMPPEYGLSIMRIMDSVWEQTIPRRPMEVPAAAPVAVPSALRRRNEKLVLVTGGTGFIGSRLVRELLKRGHAVRVLVRNLSKAESLQAMGAEIVVGNMFDESTIRAAAEGAEVIYHLGATMAGQWADYFEGTIKGTERLVKAALEQGVKRFVYASTIAVYGVPSLPKGQRVVESTPCATEDLSPYMKSKIEAEKVILDHVTKDGLSAAILRLGVVYGPGKGSKISRLGYPVPGGYVKVGFNNNELPSVYVDSAVQALLLAGDPARPSGQVYNIVDDVRFRQLDFLRAMGRYTGHKVRVFFVPYTALSALGSVMRGLGKFNGIALRVASLLSPFHLRSCAIPLVYDNSKAKKELGWSPTPELEAHLKETFAPAPVPQPTAATVVSIAEARRSA